MPENHRYFERLGIMRFFTIVVELGGGRPDVSTFYNAVGYGGGVTDADITIAAKLNGRVIGAVRLCDEAGVTVLRGMQVDPACQRKGIGRSLLDHCIPYLNRRTAYCLPYEHLVQFYGRGGFVIAPPATLPSFLAGRLAAYALSGQRTLAMKRQSDLHRAAQVA